MNKFHKGNAIKCKGLFSLKAWRQCNLQTNNNVMGKNVTKLKKSIANKHLTLNTAIH